MHLSRGAQGRYMRQAAELSTQPSPRMPIAFNVATTIRRPRPNVAAVLRDPARDAEWTAGVVEAMADPPGLRQAGSTVTRVIARRRHEIEDVEEVLEVDEDRILVLARDHPCPMELHFELERIPEGTLLRVHVDAFPGLSRRLLRPLLHRTLRRGVLRDLAALKALMESPVVREGLRS